MRTVLLGLLGLALAVIVGLGVHLLTRSTISLPVVRLEPAPALAPPAATTKDPTDETTTGRTGTGTESEPRTASQPASGTGTETGDDNSGRGRGRGRSGGNSGSGGGDD